MSLKSLLCLTVAAVTAFIPFTVGAKDEYEHPPINYSQAVPKNSVAKLQSQIDAGKVTLKYDSRHGYLKDVLKGLGVPIESQMLVFSKSSLQVRRISPATPRAIYFNDNVYVGYSQSGDLLEISAVDPQLGSVFYTLNQESSQKPQFERRVDHCLVCHSSSRTEGIPGHLVRSLYVDSRGTPVLSSGSRIVDHTTPLKHRWGGWYVTGTHGSQSHLGNLVIDDGRVQEPVDNSAGQNLTSLGERFAVDHYLSPHSDIVALMVLEHQTLVQNHITKANFETRQALAYELTLKEAMGDRTKSRLESTTRRIQSAGDRLVETLFLVGEAPLTERIRGTSGFAELFPKAGPPDRLGRSLRDLDLQSRLFKYPCSYLIYSEAFDGLPEEVKSYVWQRIHEVLTEADQSEKYSHLSSSDRSAILDILRETKSDLPAVFAGTGK